MPLPVVASVPSQLSARQGPKGSMFSRCPEPSQQRLFSTPALIESFPSLSNSHCSVQAPIPRSGIAVTCAFGGRRNRGVLGGGIPPVRFSRIALHTRSKQSITSHATTTRNRSLSLSLGRSTTHPTTISTPFDARHSSQSPSSCLEEKESQLEARRDLRRPPRRVRRATVLRPAFR